MRRMRAVLAAIVMTGCASGSAANQQVDADPGKDAPESFGDARLADARPPDAFVFQDACVPQAIELLANPALDLTPAGVGWTGARDPQLAGFAFIGPDPTGFASHSTPNKAWFGGAAGLDLPTPQSTVADSLYQDVTIPATATSVVISGQWAMGTNDDPTMPFDTFALALVQPNGTPIETILTLDNTSTPAGAWVAFSHPVTASLAGQTVRLRATSLNDVVDHTNFFLDTLTVTATGCP